MNIRLTLKSSCDACTASKVKCSGEDPCTRCVKKGVSCFYSPKKKRGPMKRERSMLVSNQPMVIKSSIEGSTNGLSSLGSHERRSWSVFFTLYKYYGVSCSLFWFNRQLHKMRLYLLKQNKKDALKRLSSWMEALNIDEEELAGKVEACNLKLKEWGKSAEEASAAAPKKRIQWNRADAINLNRGSAPFHLRVNGEYNAPITPSDNASTTTPGDIIGSLDFSEGAEPGLQFSVDYLRPSSNSKVYTNSSFAELMGYDAKDIERDLEESGGGFLPWGGDVLSRILVNESDLLSFVQILAIKFNALGKPEEWPVVRTMPSVHIFDINHASAKDHGPIKAMVKCSHREVIADDESTLHVFMSFAPLSAVPKSQAATTDIARTKIEDHVELFPKRRRDASYVPADLPGKPNEEDPHAHIYQYSNAAQDLKSGTGSLTQQQHLHPVPRTMPHRQPQYPIGSLEPAFATSQYNDSLPSTPQLSAEQQSPFSYMEAPDRKVFDDDTNFPDAVFNDEDDIVDSLPLVDNNEEGPLDSNADDGAWLDELLNWAGPPANVASS